MRGTRKRGGLRATIPTHLTTEQMGLWLIREAAKMSAKEKLAVRIVLRKAFGGCRLGPGRKQVN